MRKAIQLAISIVAMLALVACGAPVSVSDQTEIPQLELSDPADKTELEQLISSFRAYSWDNFTDESGEALKDAIAEGRKVLDDGSATQEEVDEAVESIEQAKAALEEYPKADKAALVETAAKANALNPSDYEEASYAELQKVLVDAAGVVNNRRATQEQVDQAVVAVNQAVESLVPKPTVSQDNATRKARQMLSTMPYSRDGLAEQLVNDGFSWDDANYGVDHCGADWDEQAKRMARYYQKIMPQSRDGLIEQMEFAGFTHEQAVLGADSVGL